MNRSYNFKKIVIIAFALALSCSFVLSAARTPDEPRFSDVFVKGEEGYPFFRIPSLVASNKGTILAFAEARQGGDHSQNDLVLKRSRNKGATWGPMITVLEDGKNVLVNPCAVTLDSGRVLLMFQRFPAGYHARAMGDHVKLLTPGLKGDTISKTLIMHSDDDGQTWSKPRDVTVGTKRPTKINSTATGPGVGIVLREGSHKGRIVIPTNEGWWEGKNRFFNVYACYSDDEGQTWQYGAPAPNGSPGNGNEVQMVELTGGAIMLNSRGNGGERYRKTAISKDGGATWSALQDDPHLPEPQCMGSILRYSRATPGAKSRILFANPGTQAGRKNGTVRMSYDEGKTWPVSKTIYPAGYAYSCLSAAPDGSIGLLFEADGYKRIVYACFTLDWLIKPEISDIFVAGRDDIEGVENAREKYPQFREQNIVVTNSGAVVVVCQARNKSSWSDRSGQDLVCTTSRDSGATWTKPKLIATYGLHSICPNAAVYDRDKNRIHVLYNLFTWDFPTPPKHIRGEIGETTCRQFLITSDDDGATWSEPRDITKMVDAKGAVAVFGSGEGIQLRLGAHKGRLLVAGGDFYQGKKVHAYISDDHGKTWSRGNAAATPGEMAMASETKVAELPDGTVILNSRTFVKTGDPQRLRTRAFSRDGGLSWTPLENDPALKTVSCNGALLAVSHPSGKDGTLLLCSVPVGPGRTHGAVYVSRDGGKTWPIAKLLIKGSFAYSSLAQLPDGALGLFYETENYSKIQLARFSLEWLLEDEEK